MVSPLFLPGYGPLGPNKNMKRLVQTDAWCVGGIRREGGNTSHYIYKSECANVYVSMCMCKCNCSFLGEVIEHMLTTPLPRPWWHLRSHPQSEYSQSTSRAHSDHIQSTFRACDLLHFLHILFQKDYYLLIRILLEYDIQKVL